MNTFNERFLSTLKQTEISNWIEINVIRRIGFVFALFFNKLGIHPNTITILSMIIGAGSAYFFASGSWYYVGTTGLIMNMVGVVMLLFADLLDNTDGQLARLSGKKSRIGRILDGMAGFVWAIPIYLALAWRIYQHHDIEFGWLGIENNETNSIIFGIIVLILVFYSGFACHGGQQRVSDYYVQAHLFFMNASNGHDLETSKDVQDMLSKLTKDSPWYERLFMKSYVGYTQKQEKATPKFQLLLATLRAKYGDINNIPDTLRQEMRVESLRCMRYDYIGFMYRAITLSLLSIADIPLIHFIFEVVVLGLCTRYLICIHEKMCEHFTSRL